jgi:uncharacterized protein involved in response to NO
VNAAAHPAKPGSSASQRRAYTGPAVFSHGYRPFFLGAAVWAVLAMAGWIGLLTSGGNLPSVLAPVDWHAHALLFGYGEAAMSGFLLTAVPNWTGRLPLIGWPLALLAGLWVAGRLAVTFGAAFGPWPVGLIDLAAPALLWLAIAREVIAGKNWKNLKTLGLLGLFVAANALFHVEAASGLAAASGQGARLGLAALVGLVLLVGGRIVPGFTRNWLAQRGIKDEALLPAREDRLDRWGLVVCIGVLGLWAVLPRHPVTGGLLLAGGLACAARLARWKGAGTLGEPLVWVLHLAMGFAALGFLVLGAAILFAPALRPAGEHVWLAGAVGLTTLAVMSRASLGHGGLPLTVGWRVGSLYGLVAGAVVLRVAGGVWPGLWLIEAAGLCWIGAFAGFAILYWPVLTRPRGTVRFRG